MVSKIICRFCGGSIDTEERYIKRGDEYEHLGRCPVMQRIEEHQQHRKFIQKDPLVDRDCVILDGSCNCPDPFRDCKYGKGTPSGNT
jgi:hypothetical protein